MEEFMNKPFEVELSASDIVREYNRGQSITSLSKISGVSTTEIRKILKTAKCELPKRKRKVKMKPDSLTDLGMGQSDFKNCISGD